MDRGHDGILRPGCCSSCLRDADHFASINLLRKVVEHAQCCSLDIHFDWADIEILHYEPNGAHSTCSASVFWRLEGNHRGSEEGEVICKAAYAMRGCAKL